MALQVTVQEDPDFPNRRAYRIDCPNCKKFFIGASEAYVRNLYLNHRQIHSGERTE